MCAFLAASGKPSYVGVDLFDVAGGICKCGRAYRFVSKNEALQTLPERHMIVIPESFQKDESGNFERIPVNGVMIIHDQKLSSEICDVPKEVFENPTHILTHSSGL